MNGSWRIISLSADFKIHGVWRLSDNKRFFVGDQTIHGPIVSFSVSKGSIIIRCGYSKMYGVPELTRYSTLRLSQL